MSVAAQTAQVHRTPPYFPVCEPWLGIPRTAAACCFRRHWPHEMHCYCCWPAQYVRPPDDVRRIPFSVHWLMGAPARCMGSGQPSGSVRNICEVGWGFSYGSRSCTGSPNTALYRGKKGFRCVLARIACLGRATPNVHHQGVHLICSSAHISDSKADPFWLGEYK